MTPKQQRFVLEYLIDLNATQAAIRAGYSEKTAYSSGQRLLKDVDIQAAIQEARAKQEKRTCITADRILQELAEIALSDASDHNDSDLRYSNKLRALELLGKYKGMDRPQSGSEESTGGIVILPEIMDGDDDA